MRTVVAFGGAVAAAILCGGGLAAQSVESVYSGKQIRMVIASGAGGGYDTYARVLARHLGRHVPGQPGIVNQNMDGASGLTATNWAFNVAPKDGSVVVSPFNTVLLEPLFGNKAAQYDTRQFEWIGSIGKQQQTCVTWHTSPIKTIEDALKREALFAATGATSNSATMPKIINEMIGTKFKLVTGYGSTETRLAVERGEAEGVCQSWSTLKAAAPTWLQDKRINVLIQSGGARQQDLPDVPLLIELAKNPEDRAILKFLDLPDEAGRPFAMPPGTPAVLVAALRRAFDATMKDAAFLAEAEKVMLEVEPLSGAAIQKLVADAYAAPPALVERGANLMNRQTR